MANISRMEDGLLDPKHKLYELLKSSSAPKWWSIVKEDPELYIDIRKGNEIDVYYLGGRLGRTKLNRNGSISLTAHPKYVYGKEGENYENALLYRKRIKDGKIEYDAIYQECSEMIENNLSKMKENVRTYYSGETDGENTAEKFIQGNIVLQEHGRYFDTEFAHRLYDEQRKTIRIDLVRVDNNKVTFVELKRIVDNRLRTTKAEGPEILTQMTEYRDFIKVNQDQLLRYYKQLLSIKKELELPIPQNVDINKLLLNQEPVLLIALNYDKTSPAREERVADIKKVLKSIDIVPEIL